MAKIVMFWDCPYCGRIKIPGYTRECEDGCGHPRPRKVNFYHSDPATEATPAQAVLFGKPDPNWYCEGCDSGNRDEDSNCWKCGAPRTENSEVHETRVYHSKELPRSAEEAREAALRIPAEQRKMHPTNSESLEQETPVELRTSKESFNFEDVSEVSEGTGQDYFTENWKVFAGIALAVLIAGLLVYNFFIKTHTETVVVTDMSWNQTVHIEEYQTLHEEGWSIPNGGRETLKETRKSGDKKVHDGWETKEVPSTCYDTRSVPDTCTGTRSVPDTCYRDNGDGSSESYSCSTTESYTYSCTTTETYSYSCTESKQVELYHYEDVFSTYYFYDIERWIVIGNYPTSGHGPNIFYDPIQPQTDKQRRIEVSGTYTVTFSSEEIDPFQESYDVTKFVTYQIGQHYEVEVNAFSVVLRFK